MRISLAAFWLAAAALLATSAHAQEPQALVPEGEASRIDGPPAPLAPDVVSRDERGGATVRAIRLEEPLRLDGRLDEPIYSSARPIDGFIQQEPVEGAEASERTEVWVFFDGRNLYVSARCFDAHPERWVLGGRQRDGNLTQTENFAVALDPSYGHRDGFYFQTNVVGAMRDQVFTDEGNPNASWNTVWRVRTARFDGGWSLEMEIPFKSLRYPDNPEPVWGVNFRRIIRWNNESMFLTRVPAQYGDPGIYRLSVGGSLVGLEPPANSLNLEFKPYALASMTTDRAASVPYANDFRPAAGFDFKYGLTRSLISDFTYNTDFAQVEEDLQQVNLTRLSLFFPERRDFFLEGQGIFAFGGASTAGGDVPILFFSRRIGLAGGQAIPVLGGARLAGKAGRHDVGLLQVATDEKEGIGVPQTNFSVVRVKRAILRQSYIGAIAARRSPGVFGEDANLTAGADVNLALSRTVTVTSYYAQTRTPGLIGNESSYRGRFTYSSDRYGLQGERVMVGDAFNPEVGFLGRENFARTSADARFSPRLSSTGLVRKLYFEGYQHYITDAAGDEVETRELQGAFRVEMQNSDEWRLDYFNTYESLDDPLGLAAGVIVPPGQYRFGQWRTDYTLGQQRSVSGRIRFGSGEFYDGHRTEVGFGSGRVRLSPTFEFEPGFSFNWIDLPGQEVLSRLVSTRLSFTPNTRLLVGGLVQYNSGTGSLSSSARLRFEYTAGSELFVVYSDGRNALPNGSWRQTSHSLAVKVTRLFRL